MLSLILTLIATLTLMITTPLSPAQARISAEKQAEEGIALAETASAIGKPAPAFTGMDADGKTRNLSDFAGKVVVLEWTNHECPYVRKLYDTNTMQTLQKDTTDKGVIWLTINSSAEGKQGFTRAHEAKSVIAREKSHETARILDSEGTIGRLYGASTTPHMFIIDQQGHLAYAGAIDDKPSVSHSTTKGAHNYVKNALEDLASGQAVKIPTSKPYGCGVKY